MSQLYRSAKGAGSSAASALNTNKGDTEQWDRIVVRKGVKPDSYRYVGPKEAAKIAKEGYVTNVDQYDIPKNVLYTPDEPLTSASQAQNVYNLPNTPTHRVGLDTNGITNIYGGNVEGKTGIEISTPERIPAVDIEQLGE